MGCFKFFIVAVVLIEINSVLAKDPTCYQCNSKDDGDNNCGVNLNETAMADKTCVLTDNTKKCVVYQTTTEEVTRDCVEDKDCSALYADDSIGVQVCDECADDKCNAKLDTSKTCVHCDSTTDGDDCAQDVVNTTKVTGTCYLDSVKTACVAYRYMKDGKPVTVRDCVNKSTDGCSMKYADDSIGVQVCDECADDKCNAKLDTSKTCVQCDSTTDGDDCAQDVVDTTKVTGTCYLDSVKTACVAYRYMNASEAVITARGCVSGTTNNCKTLYSDSLVMCNECSDSNNCNQDVETTTKHNTCIECEDDDESKCAASADNAVAVNTTCSLDDTVITRCQTYKFVKDGKVITHRGCARDNDCTDKNKNNNTDVCTECSGTAECNKYQQNVWCIKCTGDDNDCAVDDMNSSKVKEYCVLGASTQCIAYKHSDKTNTTVYVRDCVNTETTNCASLKSNTTINLQQCNECTNQDLCNKKINIDPVPDISTTTQETPTTTDDAPSIVNFGVSILSLLTAVLINLQFTF